MSGLFGSGDEDACDAFLACRNHSTKADTRDYMESAWERVGHLVGDRQQHFLKEFRSNFLARSWELYLLDVLSVSGWTIEPGKPEGPDIRASVNGKVVWVEAVIATAGQEGHPDAVPQRYRGPRLPPRYPEAQLLLRYRSALEEKLRKVDGYVEKGIVGRDEPVLVAINYGGIESADLHDLELPAMVKAVFPIGEPVFVARVDGSEAPHVEVPPRFAVTKKKGAGVSTTLFLEPRSASLSGVVFASQVVWGLRKSAASDLGLVHNPMAAAPLARGALRVRSELWVENEQLRREGRWSQYG